MAFLYLFFTVALSLCVVGLIVLALSSILASVRDDWRLKKPKREPRPTAAPNPPPPRASPLAQSDFSLSAKEASDPGDRQSRAASTRSPHSRADKPRETQSRRPPRNAH